MINVSGTTFKLIIETTLFLKIRWENISKDIITMPIPINDGNNYG